MSFLRSLLGRDVPAEVESWGIVGKQPKASALVNRAGGAFYHLRALRAARTRWRPFRDGLGGFLSEALGDQTSLVIVGPSAAYCIPDEFFGRLHAVTALEPDPLARRLLARRLRRLGVRSLDFVAEDRLVAPLVAGRPGLDALLEAEPGRAVLFSNVLGQIRFLLKEPEFAKWQSAWTQRIAPLLFGRRWASFHDRVSSSAPPRFSMPYRSARRLSDAELGPSLYSGTAGTVELYDHLTEGLFPADLPHDYFHWEIEPHSHHVIEAVRGGS